MKKHLNSIVKILIVILPVLGLSQELPEVLPPSPTVANLMQFEEVPVSYYTGQPNISIPIYSKGLSGDLAVNVSLSYNTQGVKINNRSGWTGTGWSLNAGGAISRTVRGEPDEISTSTHSTKVGIYHLDDYWNYDNPSTDKAKFNYHVAGTSAEKYDNKPDLYQFNFMGYSGRFIILKEANNTLVPKFITNNSNIKVEFVNTTDYTITSFKVTDPKGYVYTFNAVESSLTYPFTGTQTQGQGSTYNVSASQAQQAYSANTAWHLTKVENSSGLELLSLAYNLISENYAVSISSTKNVILGMDPASFQIMTSNAYNQGILEPYHTISYQNVNTGTQKLSNISFPQDNVVMSFDVDTNYTHPETLGRLLKNIEIKRGTEIDKTFTFDYEETIDNSTSVIKKRVWLTKLTETSGNIDQEYQLNYYQKENLPGFNDGYQDSAWGYNSGINLGLLSCSNNTYNDNIIKTGLLSSIEYPTGGVKEFEFEHNTYSYFQDDFIGYDDYIENPRNTEIVSQFTDDLTYANGSSPVELLIDTFTLDFEQEIHISSWVTASPSQYLNEHRIKISQANNQGSSLFFDLNEQCQSSTNLSAGNYTMSLVPTENLLLDQYSIIGDYRVSFVEEKATIKQEMIGGGVRIKEIRFKDDINTLNLSKKILYEYKDENNSNLSSGVVDSKADKLDRKYIKNTSRFVFGNTLNNCGAFLVQNIQYQVTENSYNIELSQGSYVGYEHVKVTEENNGYKTYSYTSPALYPSPLGTFSYETPRPKENIDYKRGLLLEEKIFNQTGQILKEVSYKDINNEPNYEFAETLLFKDRSVFKPNCEYLQFYDLYTFYESGTVQLHVPSSSSGNCSQPSYAPTPCGAFPVLTADFNSGWAKLKGSTTKEYFYDASNTQSVKETRQVFNYNSDNYQISTQDTYYKVKGNETLLKTKYYYPVGTNLGSNSSTVINKLVASNKVTEVLETQSFRNHTPNNHASQFKISETHNIYDDFDTSSKDLMLPTEVKVGKGTLDPETRIEFLKYDSYGNPTEVKKTNGTSIIYVYGFNGSVPVAKITNGSYATVQSAVGNTLNVSGNLTTTQENNLRSNLPNAMISFYRYDPLKGVISTSDDKGYETTYEYDEFNRLKRVKDAQGKILGENSYHYKNQ